MSTRVAAGFSDAITRPTDMQPREVSKCAQSERLTTS